jgi:hypothetical protein
VETFSTTAQISGKSTRTTLRTISLINNFFLRSRNFYRLETDQTLKILD